MPTCRLSDTPLAAVLRRPIEDNERTRRYQADLDAGIDRLRDLWDLKTGLVPSRYERGEGGRTLTSPLCRAAFCWHSPLSRHRGDPDLLRFFTTGLRTMAESVDDAGKSKWFGLGSESWSQGWDVEPLIYGMHFCREELDRALLDRVTDRFSRAAAGMAALKRTPEIIGSYGNQRMVWILGLHLYGQILCAPDLIALSDRYFEDALPVVLDASGQVMEQQAPCHHYSYTAFIYAWLNLVIRGDRKESERVKRCLRWFRDRHTNSLVPLAGPSSRRWTECLPDTAGDLLPAAEQLAAEDPMPLEWATRVTDALRREKDDETYAFHRDGGHGGSVLMWAILMASDPATATPAQRAAWDAPSVACYDHTHLLKRFPKKYVIARQRYQTHYTFRDFLPFAGVQTWAWEDEPPLIHPTPLAPSTTQGWGVDTARQGASHNWGLYGAGSVGVDGYLRPPRSDGEVPLLVARHSWLWRVVVFTEASVVIYEFGAGGPRKTIWTLARRRGAEPIIRPGVVAFQERKGRIHTSLDALPLLRTLSDEHEWAEGVRQLEYDCGEGLCAFALSDAAFRFEKDPLHFRDASGAWRVVPDPRLFATDNPGCIGVDTWQLAHGSVAVRA